MKKNFFAALMLCGAVVNVNAEELVSEASMNNAPVAEAVEAPEATGDTIFVYTGNPAAVEYTPQLQAASNQAVSDKEKPGQKWRVCATVGNNPEPVELWSADRYGAYVGVKGKYAHFDGRDLYYVGAEAGYLKRWGGVGAYVDYGRGYQARSSQSRAKVNELNYGIRAYLPCVEIRMGKGEAASVMSLRPYAGLGAKKARDLQYDSNSYVEYEELEDGGLDIITTVKNGRLDARPRVLKWTAGVQAKYDFWGTPLSIVLDAGVGKTQNFTYIEKQWHGHFEVGIGLTYRLGNRHGYSKGIKHKYLCEDLGYSREEVKKYNW